MTVETIVRIVMAVICIVFYSIIIWYIVTTMKHTKEVKALRLLLQSLVNSDSDKFHVKIVVSDKSEEVTSNEEVPE